MPLTPGLYPRISKPIVVLLGMMFMFLLGVNSAFASNSLDPVKTENGALTSAFNPKSFSWNIDWPGRISRYDLAYLSPPVDPMQGLPLGNGDVSALVWCEGSKIIMVLNKCDLWDDSQTGKQEVWDEKYDYYTTQRQACRIEIDFKYPVFNTLYLTDFKARLSLSDARLILDGSTPFGHLAFSAFIDHQSGLLLCNIESAFQEDVPMQISVDRFGSRTYSMWYTRMRRDAEIGLAGTEASADDKNVFITQKLTSGTFAVEGSVVKTNGLVVSTARDHSRLASIQLSGNRDKKVQIAFAVSSPVSGDPLLEVKNKISTLEKHDLDSKYLTHSAYWKSIWNRSFVDYGDDYLNNLWYLTMYYAHASQGGKYPGRFNNGLWGWNHDVQQWNFYFHWNQQQLYWPLNAAGFHDLVTPYLDYRFHSLQFAKKDAKEVYHADGAFISDVTNRNGYNRIDSDVKYNHTPVAEIALDFWRQYQFTNDKKFLNEQALPFILEASRFFQSLLIKESDGLYHAKEGTGYEGVIKLRDGLTELVYARKLFMVALEALKTAGVEAPEAAIYRDVIDHLAPVPVVKASQSLIKQDEHGAIINRGIFKGYPVPGNQIVAAGWGIKEKNWLTTWYQTDDPQYAYLLQADKNPKSAEFRVLDGIFPAVPWSPVFPSGLVGLKQKDDSLFKIMTSTLRLYGTENMGWEPVPIVMARLGLAKELATNLAQFPAKWQFFANGWGHISSEVVEDAQGTSYFKTNMANVVGSSTGEKVPVPAWPFRHMSMEAMSLLATAMNESMLQSYDGTIRVFPAFNPMKNGRFTLHAQGGFIISSEIRAGKICWVAIKSINGQDCKLVLPWGRAFVTSNRNNKCRELKGNIVTLKTKPNEQIVLLPNKAKADLWVIVGESPSTNEQVKYHESGKTQLGIPRMF